MSSSTRRSLQLVRRTSHAGSSTLTGSLGADEPRTISPPLRLGRLGVWGESNANGLDPTLPETKRGLHVRVQLLGLRQGGPRRVRIVGWQFDGIRKLAFVSCPVRVTAKRGKATEQDGMRRALPHQAELAVREVRCPRPSSRTPRRVANGLCTGHRRRYKHGADDASRHA